MEPRAEGGTLDVLLRGESADLLADAAWDSSPHTENTGNTWRSSTDSEDAAAAAAAAAARAPSGRLRRRAAPPQQQQGSPGANDGVDDTAAAVGAAGVAALLPAVHALSLTFADPALEACFKRSYSGTMWRVDFVGLLAHLFIYGTLLFSPGPLGYLAWKLPWHTMARGMSYLPWFPVLLIPSLRRWYLSYRDCCLCFILLNMSCYMVTVQNHQPWVDPAFATHAMFQGGIHWPSFSLLFLQPRVLYHRYVGALMAALQLPAVHAYCGTHFAGNIPFCMFKGVVKVSLVSLLPLAAVYTLEGRARRIFLRQHGERHA